MFTFLSIVSLLATLPLAQSNPNPTTRDAWPPAWPYGSQTVRGVNLGGWLVLEPWITPSLFEGTGNPDIVDEWTFGQYQDPSLALETLIKHWDTWITEDDFKAIAAAGLNHVRIPIGYWAYEVGPGEPFIQGQHDYLLRAIDWAEANNLQVIVDLHGAPGSQNGADHSGHRMSAAQWVSNQTDIDRTNAIIKRIASEFDGRTQVVSAIAPLNEPGVSDDGLSVLRQYYYDSYGNIRFPFGDSQQSNTLVLLHDAWRPLTYWNGFMPPPQWQSVAFDTHIYQNFNDSLLSYDEAGHIQIACEYAGPLLDFTSSWRIVGEWTPAMTDCAKYLNGRGAGSRYDGTISEGATSYGSCADKTGVGSTFTQDHKDFLRQSWEAQVITYEKANGWIMWTWKTESADEWSYSAGLQNGWIPQDPTERKYPTICG